MKWMLTFALTAVITVLFLAPDYFPGLLPGPTDDPNLSPAEKHIAAGKKWRAEGNEWKARQSFSKAIKHENDNSDAYFLRGSSQFKLNYFEKAIKDFSKALELDPENSNSYYNRALAHASNGNHNAALEDFNKTLQLNPNDVAAYRDRGITKQKLNDLFGAAEDYQESVRLNTNYVSGHVSLGAVLLELGRKEEGLKHLEKAVALDPSIKKHFVLVDGCGVVADEVTGRLRHVPCI